MLIICSNSSMRLPKNIPKTSLPKFQNRFLECSESSLVEECSANLFCPSECQCIKGIVRCSRNHLTEIPKGIPPDTTELYLDVNEIKSIDTSKIQHLKALKRLDFSNNQIAILQNNTFKELENLATLVVSYNKLGCVERDAFRGLKNLRLLSLHGNDVSYLPEGTFKDLQSLSHIALGANPLYCDCSLAWLAKWVKNDYVEPGIAKCAEPRTLRDKLVLTTTPAMFTCQEKVPYEVLAKCDMCYTFPCQNGGSCTSLPGKNYECICAPGYHGTECQYKIDACYGNPCVNGGTCKVFETGRFSCHCPLGFEGEHCEKNIDECIDHKCINGGVCVDEINTYSCSCPEGFSGEHCQIKVTFCSKSFNPCENGATCKESSKGYTCLCSDGWQGVNCSQNLDDCVGNMCQNGAQCIDGIGSYECKCVGDWSGRFCELGPSVLQQTEPCLQHDCHHGVCIVPRGKSEYVCKCHSGYSGEYIFGKYCEYQTSLSFVDMKSFLQMESPSFKKHVNISLSFTTSKTSGILLYLGQNREHLAVELFQKRIRISFDCGNRPTSVMFSYEVVSNEKKHTVELNVDSHNITLRIDGGKPRKMTNRGKSPYLNVDSPLFVGGIPQDMAEHAVRLWHVRDATSFIGCLDELSINEKVQDLSKSEKQNKVIPGCGDAEQRDEGKPLEEVKVKNNDDTEKNICEKNRCENGKCRPRKDKKGYRCRCKKGFSGKFCNKVPTCQKASQKAYVYDYGCRSRRPVRQFRCEGSCGHQCCRPKRYRTKKVAMICNDGTKFIKKVDIIRKCRCLRKCTDD
ncbi:Protein slit [Armadillidium vulgare]|nr:Protein slit [Armadillidium vulgare]